MHVSIHEEHMREALALARRGEGTTRPNPLVGALIVRKGAVVGRGWHERAGQPHAEVNAVEDARRRGEADLSGATLYVTLEPCSHTGRTPPCADLLIRERFGAVVAGMTDPDPRVAGSGFERLRAAGVSVTVGVLEAECRELNEVFITWITKKRPYVFLKMAATLDGSTIPRCAEGVGAGSRYISCGESLLETHRLRARYSAIMVGVNTVIADDPALDVRLAPGANPVRVVVDSSFCTPTHSKVIATARAQRTIVAGIEPESPETINRIRELASHGAEIVTLPAAQARVHLPSLMARLAESGIDSLLLEGGLTLAREAIKCGLVDRARWYVAPRFSAPGSGAGEGSFELRKSGEDAVLEWKPEAPCLPA